MADGEQTPSRSRGWPPPHPSPPLPPPREYGAPGSTPSRTPWLAALAVVLVLSVVGLLVAVLDGGDAEPESTTKDTPSESAEPSATVAVAAYACWDGAAAATLEECSAPTGAAGLAWVFPVIADARCGEPSAKGGDGVVTRVLCLYRLADGTRARLGFYEWASVEQGTAFYDGQGLTRTEATSILVRWADGTGEQGRAITMYAEAPYSSTVSYAAGATPSGDDVAALQPRPATEVRGVPAQ